MTIEDVYTILESRIYYQKEGMKKFTFAGNAIHIDRRAFIPFDIYKENESFYLIPESAIADEKELRIEIENIGGDHIHFYGKISGEKMITLE